jgi:hypothetical protein
VISIVENTTPCFFPYGIPNTDRLDALP